MTEKHGGSLEKPALNKSLREGNNGRQEESCLCCPSERERNMFDVDKRISKGGLKLVMRLAE